MTRTQLTLGGLLVLQVALIALLRSPLAAPAGTVEAHLLLPGLETVAPTRVELLGPDGAAVTLRHEGEHWSVDQAGGFPADAAKIQQLLDELREIRVRRPVVSSARYHKAFKVADGNYEGRVRVFDAASEEPRADLILGDSPNYRIAHVRAAGDDRVYEARGIAPYEVRAAASAWTTKELLQVAEPSVVEITVTNAHGTFKLVRKDGTWTLAEPAASAARKLDQSKVQELVRVATTLRLDEPVGKLDEVAQGFDRAAATVELRFTPAASTPPTEDAAAAPPATPATPATEQAVVSIGAKVTGKEGQRYATRSGFGFTGTIWESSVTRLLEQKLDELFAA